MIYKLKEQHTFTLGTSEWRQVMMKEGSFVKVEGNEILIQDPLDETWHGTLEIVTPVLMGKLLSTE